MGLNSTPFLSYREIKTDEIDLYDDAWGFYPQFNDVINVLKLIKPVPGRKLMHKTLKRCRKQG